MGILKTAVGHSFLIILQSTTNTMKVEINNNNNNNNNNNPK